MSLSFQPVRLISSNSASVDNASTLNVPAVGHSPDGLLELHLCWANASGSVTSVTFQGQSLTQWDTKSNSQLHYETWILANPPTGSDNIIVTFSTNVAAIGLSASLINAFTLPLYTDLTSSGTNTTSAFTSTNIESVNTRQIYGIVIEETGLSSPTIIPAGGAATVTTLADIRAGGGANKIHAQFCEVHRTTTNGSYIFRFTFNSGFGPNGYVCNYNSTIFPAPQKILTPQSVAEIPPIFGSDGEHWTNISNALGSSGFASIPVDSRPDDSFRLSFSGFSGIPSNASIVAIAPYVNYRSQIGGLALQGIINKGSESNPFNFSNPAQDYTGLAKRWCMGGVIVTPDSSTFGFSYTPSDFNSLSLILDSQDLDYDLNQVKLAVYYTVPSFSGNMAWGVSGGVSSGKVLATS